MTKTELRVQIRANHPGQGERGRQSALICQHILNSSEYQAAQVIGGYVPLMREADIMPVLLDVLASGRILALPRCLQSPDMQMHRVTELDSLMKGPIGLLEPADGAEIIAPDEINLIIVPLEGIDPQGLRLGKGGGYYDHFLSQTHIPNIGVALLHQWTRHLPADPWDVPLQACADANGIHRF